MKAQVTSLLGELQESQSRLESSRRERGELEMRWGLLGGSRGGGHPGDTQGMGAPRCHWPTPNVCHGVPLGDPHWVPLPDPHWVPWSDPHWVPWSDPHWVPWGALI